MRHFNKLIIYLRVALFVNMEKAPSEQITAKLDLFEACKEGNMDVVRKLVNQNTVNSRDSGGRKSTPLHFAAGSFL